MKNVLKANFEVLLQKYSNDQSLIEQYWHELQRNYSSKSRHYHNLTHIANMLYELNDVAGDVEDIETLQVAIFYYDVVYNATKTDNEYKSAIYMQKEMSKTSFSNIQKCFLQIEATKQHMLSQENDINILLDLDLAILGKPQAVYHKYTQNIRKEYSIYPTFMYNKGRIKALEHLYGNGTIFKTKYFQYKYEDLAKENIMREIKTIQNQ